MFGLGRAKRGREERGGRSARMEGWIIKVYGAELRRVRSGAWVKG